VVAVCSCPPLLPEKGFVPIFSFVRRRAKRATRSATEEGFDLLQGGQPFSTAFSWEERTRATEAASRGGGADAHGGVMRPFAAYGEQQAPRGDRETRRLPLRPPLPLPLLSPLSSHLPFHTTTRTFLPFSRSARVASPGRGSRRGTDATRWREFSFGLLTRRRSHWRCRRRRRRSARLTHLLKKSGGRWRSGARASSLSVLISSLQSRRRRHCCPPLSPPKRLPRRFPPFLATANTTPEMTLKRRALPTSPWRGAPPSKRA